MMDISEDHFHKVPHQSLSCFQSLSPGFLWCVLTVNQFSSVAQSCPTVCDPIDCSMPGFPVHHQLPELAQIHAHRVSDVIHLIPFFSSLQHFPASGSFLRTQFLTSGVQSIGISASPLALPMNIRY